MDKRFIKIGEKIRKIKTSQQSQHDIIKEILSELLDIISEELSKRSEPTLPNKDKKE